MRRGFLWLLAGAVAMSAVALWVPQKAQTLVQAIDSRRSPEMAVASRPDARALSLPETLDRTKVEAARRDPFADVVPVTAAMPVAASLPVAPPAPAPSPPPMQWRLLGVMHTPEGQRLVMLTHASDRRTVVAQAGVELDGGYQVTAVTADTVRLLYPPLHTEVLIPIAQHAPEAAVR